MRTRVAIMGGFAEINDGRWTASRPAILSIVRDITPSMLGPAYAPDVDLALAEEAARLFGGGVTEYDGPPEIQAGRVY